MKKIIITGLFALIVVLAVWHFSMTVKSYKYTQPVLPETFDEFYSQKLKRSSELNVRPKNEEKLIRYADKTPLAILYIHGYGASRAEGEYVVDKISKTLRANTYYLRLPGHGTNVEEQSQTMGKEHLDEAITTLTMMRKLGDKVIVIGTSMGGVVATYIAAENPELIDAMILSAPAYQFASAMAKAAAFYPLFTLVTTVMERSPSFPIPAEKDNWSLYWYSNQYMKSLKQLYQLQLLTSRNSIYRNVKQPVMMIYYYKDENNQDSAASVSDMRKAYRSFNNGIPDRFSKEVPVDTGGHVLLSKYVKIAPDYDMITREAVSFINGPGWNK